MNKHLKKDISRIKEFFPKLKYGDGCFIGIVDIVDMAGDYWDDFKIKITVPQNYPYGVPLLYELSNKITRDNDMHISPDDGLCCVDIYHELIYLSKKGITIFDFLKQKVYPYLANQIFYKSENKFANGEYKHNFDGIVQFYKEKLSINNPEEAVKILNAIILNRNLNRNDSCPCNSIKKIKHCHGDAVEYLKVIGIEILKDDLKNFKQL